MRKEDREEKKDEKAKTLRRIGPLMEALFYQCLKEMLPVLPMGVEVVRWPFWGVRDEKRRKEGK